MTTTTPEVFVWIEPVAPAAVVRVRAADGTTYHRYTDWVSPSVRAYVTATGHADADERWVADAQPDEDGNLDAYRWFRLLADQGPLTDITDPGDIPKDWRTDSLPAPAVTGVNAAKAFEAVVWKLAGLRTLTFTAADVQQELAVRSTTWVSQHLDFLVAGISQITGVVVRRLPGPGNPVYEIRHWAAGDPPVRP